MYYKMVRGGPHPSDFLAEIEISYSYLGYWGKRGSQRGGSQNSGPRAMKLVGLVHS